MQCIAQGEIPRPNWTGYNTKYMAVKCGKCPECLKRRATEWAFRMRQEYKESKTSAFLTLTYNDEHLPRSPLGHATLHTPDLQKYMKRLRKTTHDKIIAYGCGEYGEEFQRPHFHQIIFNIPQHILEPEWDEKNEIWKYTKLENIWKHGQVHNKPVNDARMRYVANYVQKTIVNPKDPNDDRIRERSYISQGLGKGYLTENIKRYYKEKMIPYIQHKGGEKIPMPRYYKDKIYDTAEQKYLADVSGHFIDENSPFIDTTHEVAYIWDAFQKQERRNREKPRR